MGKCYTYLSILNIDGTNLCLTDTGAKRGKLAPQGGESTILTNEECVCVPHMCAMEGFSPLWSGSRGLLKMEGRGILKDLIQGVGQLVLPQIPVV